MDFGEFELISTTPTRAFRSDVEVPQYHEPNDFFILDYMTIMPITRRRHRFAKRLPLFYFDSQFNVDIEAENEVSEGIFPKSYCHILDSGLSDGLKSYIHKLTLQVEAFAELFIKKSYRSPYVGISMGREVPPHVHLFHNPLDSMTSLRSLSFFAEILHQNVTRNFLSFPAVEYANTDNFKKKYNNELSELQNFKTKPENIVPITNKWSALDMNSSGTVHSVTEGDSACVFFLYDKVELRV